MNADIIRELERKTIRKFVEDHRNYLTGRVLDFGAGKPGTCREPQPYRDLVSGEYVPYDLGDEWPAGSFDAVLLTQVLQYVDDPSGELKRIRDCLALTGWFVGTYGTCWPEIEPSDKWRFTKSGMARLLANAGFYVITHETRAVVDVGGWKASLGGGFVALRS